jgi:hypothetical protein
MPQRSREEKLAAYSKGAKRGYRSRKRMQAYRNSDGPEMKTAQPGEVEPLNDDPGGIVASRALGNAGLGDAAQNEQDVTSKCNLANHQQIVNRVMHPLS